MTGDTIQGGTLVFVPGTWTGAISYRYRVLRGDVSAPASPIDVLLDWTPDTSTLVDGIADGDYLWLQEEATGAGGVAVATAAAGHGPMEALPPADASIIGIGGLNTAAATTATQFTFDMDIANVPARGLLLFLTSQGTSGASNPTWDAVSVEGVPMTLLYRGSQLDGTRWVGDEIWYLWGNDLPVGTGMTVQGTRSASTNSMRQAMAAIAIGNTQAAPPVAGDVAMLADLVDRTTYTFSGATTAAKQLVVAFPHGQFAGFTSGLTYTPDAAWNNALAPWPAARNGTSLTWAALMTKVYASAGAFSTGYSITESGATSQRYGLMPYVRLQGDNS